jgi:hypothetical protein
MLSSESSNEFMVVVLKVLHSVLKVFMILAIIYLFYSAFTRTYDWKLFLAIGALAIEGLALAFCGGGRCPLTKLTRYFGDEKGHEYIAEYLVPERFIPYIVPFWLVTVSIAVITLVANFFITL